VVQSAIGRASSLDHRPMVSISTPKVELRTAESWPICCPSLEDALREAWLQMYLKAFRPAVLRIRMAESKPT